MDRVLRPGRVGRDDGRVALLWNVRDDSDPMEAAATAVMEQHRHGTPGHQTMDLQAQLDASPFTEVDVLEWPWTIEVDEATFVDRFLSVSFVASLDPAATADVEAALMDVFAEHAHDGMVQHAYTCRSHILERRG